jgi:hypothetical protein
MLCIKLAQTVISFKISAQKFLRIVTAVARDRREMFLEHVFKKMCSIEIVPLSVCPSVRLFPIFFTFLHLETWKFEYKLRTIYLPGERPEFLIRCLEVLGLGPEHDPLQKGFFISFWSKIFSKLGFQCSISWKRVFAPASDRFQATPNSEVPGS